MPRTSGPQLSLLGQNKLFYFVTNKQTNSPWNWSKLKRMTLGPLRASKTFYGGVSVDQIMQACYWKGHNTFTNFHLKDLTLSDNDNNMYLGCVVAAPQVLDPSPQTSHPGKEKRGGGGGLYSI